MSIGDSDTSSSNTATQNASSDPWAAAIPQLKQLLDTLGNQPTTPSSTTTGAIGQLITQAGAGDPNAAGVNAATASQLGASTAPQQTQVNDAYNTYKTNMTPIADGDNTDIASNPQIQALLRTVQDDTNNSVNGAFAASGRSGSGANANAVARGIASGEAPILLNQYNTETARSDAANNGLLTGAGQTADTTAGLQTTQAGIQNSGISNDPAALTAAQWGPTQIAQLSQTLQTLPLDQISQIANILFPAAQLGGTSTGTKTGSSDSDTTSFGFKL